MTVSELRRWRPWLAEFLWWRPRLLDWRTMCATKLMLSPVLPGEVDLLRNALRRLLGDPDLCRRLGNAAAITAQDYSREQKSSAIWSCLGTSRETIAQCTDTGVMSRLSDNLGNELVTSRRSCPRSFAENALPTVVVQHALSLINAAGVSDPVAFLPGWVQ